jgi:multiple sugar transport system ATP-binding protein
MEVYRYPANLFVAGFLGTPPMSLVAGGLQRRDGRLEVAGDGFSLGLPPRLEGALREYPTLTEAVIGLRPEAVRLYQQQPADSTAVQATVYAVEPLGDENIIDVRLGSALLRSRALPSVRPKVGEAVWIAPVSDAMHLFDPKSEEAIGRDARAAVTPAPEPVGRR